MSRTLGFLFQIKGCSEILFINLSDCLPPAGPLLDAQKWAEKPLGRPQTPIFVQSDAIRGDARLPLNFCGAAGPS